MAKYDEQELWYDGKLTRRRWLGLSAAAAGAIGATVLVPSPWRAAFGQAKPYKIGTLQPLSGAAAAGGKTALVGSQMAVDRINKAGGINGRPIELIVADTESKPDVGRRKAEKLAVEDKMDLHQGGFLSNVCIACMPLWDEHRILNMIGVCLDTTITTTKCSRYTFRPFDYAPAQAVACLEDDDSCAVLSELPRGGDSCETSADDDDVGVTAGAGHGSPSALKLNIWSTSVSRVCGVVTRRSCLLAHASCARAIVRSRQVRVVSPSRARRSCAWGCWPSASPASAPSCATWWRRKTATRWRSSR